ncbi:putative amidophosphoribosyltransferase [Micromonospora pisi]|uniref:Putative amidophosphoribosyltransferase n=1 Tax=Micromonospora pisi TaxID=589240 RepID=A0A495JMV7_9ACTN|nr:phosphoribosyltransferase family protein [Micromonospora pisi]RKR90346.1 putative amidophosphoribosyltransferase [Micromonospora pisi]
MTGVWADLADLVLPAECAGCRVGRTALRHGVCVRCATALQLLRPTPVRPTPAPPGLPDCAALGGYEGELREALLTYKERGRHSLARPLGRLLAEVVAATAGAVSPVPPAPAGAPRAVLLIPVPGTAAAIRARHGDHLRRLARHTAHRLRASGWPVTLASPLRAQPRPDSATLDSAGRAAAAEAAFTLRERRLPALRRAAAGRVVIVLDDIVTTGVTLAAVTGVLRSAGVRVDAAAVLAATIRRVRR